MSRRASAWFQIPEDQKEQIIQKYARLYKSGTKTGTPIYCQPSQAERRNPSLRKQSRNADGKIIYDNKALAEAANREFMALGGGLQYPYLCKRSKHGHYHLTSYHYRLERKIKEWRKSLRDR